MKKKDIFLLLMLLSVAGIMLIFSDDMRQGAYQGLVLAENTIIPSLMPLLIVFLLIMKTTARDVLARLFGFVSNGLFNLPHITFPAIFLGLIGGYPTGALLTNELFESGDIDSRQAKQLLCFCFCGGGGFIVTAVGCVRLMSMRAGIILFVSNILSDIIIGLVLSLGEKRRRGEFYSFCESRGIADAITSATDSAIKSVLSITAYVMLFGAIDNILKLPKFLMPLIEITNGICSDNSFSLPEISAYLAFGGLCIHMQIIPVILKCRVKYTHFLLSRVMAAVLSYAITSLILLVFPTELEVFSNFSAPEAVFSSVNLALSVLLILGCFVLILDIGSRKRTVDN